MAEGVQREAEPRPGNRRNDLANNEYHIGWFARFGQILAVRDRYTWLHCNEFVDLSSREFPVLHRKLCEL